MPGSFFGVDDGVNDTLQKEEGGARDYILDWGSIEMENGTHTHIHTMNWISWGTERTGTQPVALL